MSPVEIRTVGKYRLLVFTTANTYPTSIEIILQVLVHLSAPGYMDPFRL